MFTSESLLLLSGVLSPVFIFSWTTIATGKFLHISNALLITAVHVTMNFTPCLIRACQVP